MRRVSSRILDDVNEAENAIGGLIGKRSGTLRVGVGFTFAADPLRRWALLSACITSNG